MSASTIFTSSVGAIDEEHWAENIFDYGLFAYMAVMRDADGNIVQVFPLVNYYVN